MSDLTNDGMRSVGRRFWTLLPLFLALLTAAVLISVSTAAAGDVHPSGFDKSCNLCLFTKAPLISAGQLEFVPPSELTSWDVRVVTVVLRHDLAVFSGLCRAPPFWLS